MAGNFGPARIRDQAFLTQLHVCCLPPLALRNAGNNESTPEHCHYFRAPEVVEIERVDTELTSAMTLLEIVDARAIIPQLKVQNKKQLLQELAHALSSLVAIDSRVIFEALLQREKLGSTGLGQGIAIPHGRLPAINRVYGVFASLSHPVAFDSVDGEPVDLAFAMISPLQAGADHLTALAKVSRLLRDSATVAKLRGTTSREGLYAILTEPQIHAASAA